MFRPALGALLCFACAPAADQAVSSSRAGAPAATAATATAGVRGHVTDAAGKPVADVRVTAQSIDQPPRAVPEMASVTGADGAYRWPLRPGRYRLRFFADGYHDAAAEVTVPASGEATLDLRLAPQA